MAHKSSAPRGQDITGIPRFRQARAALNCPSPKLKPARPGYYVSRLLSTECRRDFSLNPPMVFLLRVDGVITLRRFFDVPVLDSLSGVYYAKRTRRGSRRVGCALHLRGPLRAITRSSGSIA